MAQGKKRASARRGKVARRNKAPMRATAKKTAKRSAVKAKPKKSALRAITKRVTGKQLTPSKVKPPQKRTERPIEVIKVETVDQPAPGTVVVTEYAEVRVPTGGSTGEKSKQTVLDLPEPEDD